MFSRDVSWQWANLGLIRAGLPYSAVEPWCSSISHICIHSVFVCVCVCVCAWALATLYSPLWSPVQMKLINRNLSVEGGGQERRGGVLDSRERLWHLCLIFQAVLPIKFRSCWFVGVCVPLHTFLRMLFALSHRETCWLWFVTSNICRPLSHFVVLPPPFFLSHFSPPLSGSEPP